MLQQVEKVPSVIMRLLSSQNSKKADIIKSVNARASSLMKAMTTTVMNAHVLF